jgi:hypothetical protein
MNFIFGIYLGFCYSLGILSILSTHKSEINAMDFFMLIFSPIIIPLIIINQITDRWT